MIHVGIYDKEAEYGMKLAAYLNRQGGMRCSAFTRTDRLEEYIQTCGLDVLASTQRDVLEQSTGQGEAMCRILFTEDPAPSKDRRFRCLYRYQSGREIAEGMRRILYEEGILTVQEKTAAAVYSPIGRCGKTGMLLDYVREQRQRRLLYIGMEDYSYLPTASGDRFLYYLKERRSDKILELTAAADGVLASPFSPYDAKCLDAVDMQWLLQVLRQESGYSGFLFDIGTGVLREPNMLTVFDRVIIPFLQGELETKKKEKFEAVMEAYGLTERMCRFNYLDMAHPERLDELLKE